MLGFYLGQCSGTYISHIIHPSQQVTSIVRSYVSNLVPVTVASLLVWEVENAVSAGRSEDVDID